ncbi:MAG: Smr/MutS family protein [Saprospiraceae bacterium]|nr:Smr/MutS family protein [Saprospiraceae bacterium]
MNYDDLWIGDEVWIRSKQTNGKWEGQVDAQTAKVRLNHKIFLVKLSDLAEPRENLRSEKAEKSKSEPQKKVHFDSKEIDLHIEKLSPHRTFQTHHQIVLHQLAKCRQFIEFAIHSRWITVVIVHGKGTGALKEEVHHLLKDYREVYHTIPKHNGGAVEIWFQYNNDDK